MVLTTYHTEVEKLAYIDTGAPTSYISREIAQQFEPIKGEKKKDFYPGKYSAL